MKLDHPFINKVYTCQFDNEYLQILNEHAAQGELKGIVDERKPKNFSEEQIINYFT